MTKWLLVLPLLLVSLSAFGTRISPDDLRSADHIARASANWFQYTTGPMPSAHLGQCGDYAVKFILDYNKYAGQNVARLVVANNPIPSGTYRIGERVNLANMGFHGFPSGASGFLILHQQIYLYHPVNGAYPLFLEKAWIPKSHFGVNMLDKRQVHVWASVGTVSVDPTYFDLYPDTFRSPLGLDK